MNECSTWASLSDKAAISEPLTAEERLFLRHHPLGCQACAQEATLWENLERVLDEPERLAASPRSVEREARLVAPRLGRRRPLLAAVAVALAAAAGAALWLRSSAPAVEQRRLPALASHRPPSAVVRTDGGAQLALSAGETRVNERVARAGERLTAGAVISVAAGQACVLVPPGVSVCLAGGTELRLETLELGKRRFRLLSGHVAAHLEPQPPGSSFGFETPAGSVVAKGTEFSLRSHGSTVSLTVHEGIVLNSQGTETSSYQAPSTALLSREPGLPQVIEDAGVADSRLLDLARYFGDRSQGVLIVTAAEGSNVALGDFYLGTAPLSALVKPGDYRMEVSRAGFAPILEQLRLEAGSHTVRDYGATAELGLAGNSAGGKPPPSASQTPAELLERARELRAGARYKEANGAYQRLVREYPGSAEARVALISLGELQLSQLGDASGALRSFDAYLRGGGPLRQEASYGRIRALRQLGRVGDARAAADAFLRAYPSSVQAATLRKELP